MAYLIKVTIVWTIFLLLFELLYKNNTRFVANRIYLLSGIAIGLLLPLIPAPSTPASLHMDTVHDLYSITQNAPLVTSGITTPQGGGTVPVTAAGPRWSALLIVSIVYGTGALMLLMKYLVELFKIISLLRKNSVRILYGHKVVTTGIVHSPYSFLNYTFLTDAAAASPEELEYIIRHEAAHYTRKHWLDLWIMQLVNIVFWFHPLVWRYRYLLQLQHEYEADIIAADNDPYTYGRFILQQTMLRGVPSITHSFHFSPIKNRIHMLTKINSLKSHNRRYLLLIPVLLGCTILTAKSADKAAAEIQGNKMSFKGNVLTWRPSDTLFYDKEKGQPELVSSNAAIKPQVIVGINNEPVYRNDYLQMQATYGNTGTAFADYVKEEFHKRRKNTADSLTYLTDLSIVVDKEGKVIYFDAHYARPERTPGQQPMLDLLYSRDSNADILVDKIIADSPLWKPAVNEGKAVNSYVNVRFPGC